MYYTVRPTKALTYKIYPAENGHISGTFTVTFTAYDPCGYLLYDKLDTTNPDSVKAADYCDILAGSYMPAAPDLNTDDFLLYNCGTEPCDTRICIAGLANDTVKIHNLTNNQTCTLNPLTGYRRLPTGNAATATDGANTLKVTATPAWENYQYRCVIRDLGGNVAYSDTVYLKLGDVPAIRITSQPVDAAVAVDETATFTVAAEGADLTYKWQWRGTGDDSTWQDCSLDAAEASFSVTAGTE